jgi:hypothetical protein
VHIMRREGIRGSAIGGMRRCCHGGKRERGMGHIVQSHVETDNRQKRPTSSRVLEMCWFRRESVLVSAKFMAVIHSKNVALAVCHDCLTATVGMGKAPGAAT